MRILSWSTVAAWMLTPAVLSAQAIHMIDLRTEAVGNSGSQARSVFWVDEATYVFRMGSALSTLDASTGVVRAIDGGSYISVLGSLPGRVIYASFPQEGPSPSPTTDSTWNIWSCELATGTRTKLATVRANRFTPGSAVLNGRLLFGVTALTGAGAEPWITDGTPAGTTLLKNIYPDDDPLFNSSYPSNFVVAGDRFYFAAMTPEAGYELWSSDGTEAGTVLLKDINAGAASGLKVEEGKFSAVVLGDKLLFPATTPESGEELWVTEGTPESTVLLHELGAGSLRGFHGSLVAGGGYAYFRGATETGGGGFYRTAADGSGPELFNLAAFAIPHAVYFEGGRPYLHVQVDSSHHLITPPAWDADYSATIPNNLIPHSSEPPQAMFTREGRVYMRWLPPWSNTQTVYQLGTLPQETVLVGQLDSYALEVIPAPASERYAVLARTADQLGSVYRLDSQTAGITRLQWGEGLNTSSTPDLLHPWGEGLVLEATANGTSDRNGYLVDPPAAPQQLFRPPLVNDLLRLHVHRDRVFFSSHMLPHYTGAIGLLGRTSEEAVVLSEHPAKGENIVFANIGDDVLWLQPTSPILSQSGYLLKASDGTPAGTRIVKEFPGECFPLVSAGNRAFFASYTPHLGPWEIWVTDGTTEGTMAVGAAASGRSPVPWVHVAGQHAYYTVPGPSSTYALWRTDGTPEGALQLSPNIANSLSGGAPTADLNGMLLFGMSSSETGRELGISDGTPMGTRILADLNPGTAGSGPGSYAVLKSRAVFSATTAATGRELFITDGTPEGTVLLADIVPGTEGSSPLNLTAVPAAGLVFFTTNTPERGWELHATDTTPEGTRLVGKLGPGAFPAAAEKFTAAGGRLYFRATDPLAGVELFYLDAHMLLPPGGGELGTGFMLR